jgi:tetratricopeptide (TPR) repeat protein
MNTAILDVEENWFGDTADAGHSGVHPVERLKRGDSIGDRFVVKGTLGAGGFAVVYEAEHSSLGRPVAIKVLHVEAETPPGLVERFRQEGRISAFVHHPNVLDVYDTGTLEDGSPYLVMELIHGETLYRRMARNGLTIPALVEVSRQLLTALVMLAARGIVHRDIKPENVMLHAPSPGMTVVKVLDFGISKNVEQCELHLTRSGAMIGTPHYMSPEQIRGEQVDPRSDLYSLGVVLYEALTGRVPYDGGSLNALIVAALTDDLIPVRNLRPDCPPELERIVLRAMSRDREQRYASPAEMQRDLERLTVDLRMPRGSEAFSDYSWSPDAQPEQAGAQSRERHLASVRSELEELTAPSRQRKRRGSRLLRSTWLRLAGVGALFLMAAADPMLEPVRPQIAEAGWHAAALAAPGDLDPRGLKDEAPPAPGQPAVSRWGTSPERAPQVTQLAPRSAHFEQDGRSKAASSTARKTASKHRARASRRHKSDGGAVAKADLHSATQIERKTEERLLRQAFAAYLHGDLEQARDLYQRVTKHAPYTAEAWRGLGLVAARLGRNDEAQRALQRYLNLAPATLDAEAREHDIEQPIAVRKQSAHESVKTP